MLQKQVLGLGLVGLLPPRKFSATKTASQNPQTLKSVGASVNEPAPYGYPLHAPANSAQSYPNVNPASAATPDTPEKDGTAATVAAIGLASQSSKHCPQGVGLTNPSENHDDSIHPHTSRVGQSGCVQAPRHSGRRSSFSGAKVVQLAQGVHPVEQHVGPSASGNDGECAVSHNVAGDERSAEVDKAVSNEGGKATSPIKVKLQYKSILRQARDEALRKIKEQRGSTPSKSRFAPKEENPAIRTARKHGLPPPRVGSLRPTQDTPSGSETTSRRGGKRSRRGTPVSEEKALELIGKVVHVPGAVFSVNIPGKFYVGDVIRRDTKHRNAMEVVFRDDKSHYWFPIKDVEEWICEHERRSRAHTKGSQKQKNLDGEHVKRALKKARLGISNTPEDEWAAEVLSEMSTGVSQSGGDRPSCR